MKFSVQTNVLPELSMEEVLQRLKRHGYDGVEWRVHDDYHIPMNRLRDDPALIGRMTEDHGLEVAGLCTYTPVHALDEIREVAEAAARMNARRFRVMSAVFKEGDSYDDLYRSTVENLQQVEEIVSGFGVKAVLETHFGTIMPSAGLTRRIVEGFDPDAIGIIYDPANMVIEGMENFKMGLDLIGGYVDHVHIKNVSWRREGDGWKWVFDTLPHGMVRWKEIMGLLKSISYNGYLSFENFAGVPMSTSGYIGEPLTGGEEEVRDIDRRLKEDIDYIRQFL